MDLGRTAYLDAIGRPATHGEIDDQRAFYQRKARLRIVSQFEFGERISASSEDTTVAPPCQPDNSGNRQGGNLDNGFASVGVERVTPNP